MKGSISFRKGKQVWWRNEIEKSSRRISGEFWQPQSPPLPRTTMRWDKSAGWIPGAPVGCRQIRWASLTFIIFFIEATDTKKKLLIRWNVVAWLKWNVMHFHPYIRSVTKHQVYFIGGEVNNSKLLWTTALVQTITQDNIIVFGTYQQKHTLDL